MISVPSLAFCLWASLPLFPLSGHFLGWNRITNSFQFYFSSLFNERNFWMIRKAIIVREKSWHRLSSLFLFIFTFNNVLAMCYYILRLRAWTEILLCHYYISHKFGIRCYTNNGLIFRTPKRYFVLTSLLIIYQRVSPLCPCYSFSDYCNHWQF